MSAATKAPREKLTLRDDVDLYLALNAYVEAHVDEIELNGGALPDDLAALLDEVDASRAERVDALAKKIDQLTGFATAAKATKDRSARREKVWNNTIAAIKAYAKHQVERNNGESLKGTIATLRLQKNGQPSVACALTDEQLIEASECSIAGPAISNHPLWRFLEVKLAVSLDTRALAAAYEARRAELEDEASLLGWSDVQYDGDADVPAAVMEERLASVRVDYVARHLTTEFPGVTVTRGHHLRVD